MASPGIGVKYTSDGGKPGGVVVKHGKGLCGEASERLWIPRKGEKTPVDRERDFPQLRNQGWRESPPGYHTLRHVVHIYRPIEQVRASPNPDAS